MRSPESRFQVNPPTSFPAARTVRTPQLAVNTPTSKLSQPMATLITPSGCHIVAVHTNLATLHPKPCALGWWLNFWLAELRQLRIPQW